MRSSPQIDEALSGLPDRHYLGGLVTVYKTPTAAGALELIAAVGRLTGSPAIDRLVDQHVSSGFRSIAQRKTC